MGSFPVLRRARVSLLVGLTFLVGGMAALAQGERKATDQPAGEPTFTFEMRQKPWATVFEWLTDKTGRPFISRTIPTGTFSFIARAGQKYTLPQVIDIINDGLILQKYVLLNRGTSFTVVAADEDVDQFLVPRVSPAELPRRGKTEIVSMLVKLKALQAADTGPEVKRQMGPFGKVVVLPKSNHLLVQDTVASLERILETVQAQEAEQSAPATMRTIILENGNAAALAEALRRRLAELRPELPVEIVGPGEKSQPAPK